MTLNIEVTTKGKPHMRYGKHKFRESHIVKSGEVVWRCLGRTCKSTVKTDAEKNVVISCKGSHSGHHPTTMWTMKSPGAQSTPAKSLAAPVIPSSANKLEPEKHPASTEVSQMFDHDTSVSFHFDAADSISRREPGTYRKDKPTVIHSTIDLTTTELIKENAQLKANLVAIQKEYKAILDHSVESDLRLMNFTDELFPSPSTKRSEGGKTKQTEQTTPCKKCKIWQEESAKMIDAIRCLEEELHALKQPLQMANSEIPTRTLTTSPSDLSGINSEARDNTEDEENFITVAHKKHKHFERAHRRRKMNNQNNSLKHPIKSGRKASVQEKGKKLDNSPVHLPFKNICVLGDSHARHLAGMLKEMVLPGTSVTGECKPNAGLMNIAPSTNRVAPVDNCYILMAGTNDVAAGKEKLIFRLLEDAMKRCRTSSKLLVCTLPHRHDLPPSSRIHHTVQRVNSFITELCNRWEGVKLLDLNSIQRRFFTSHGMHLRMSGKRLLALRLREALRDLASPSSTNTSPATKSPVLPAVVEKKSPMIIPGAMTFAEAARAPTSQMNTHHPAEGRTASTLTTAQANKRSFLEIPLSSKADH